MNDMGELAGLSHTAATVPGRGDDPFGETSAWLAESCPPMTNKHPRPMWRDASDSLPNMNRRVSWNGLRKTGSGL